MATRKEVQAFKEGDIFIFNTIDGGKVLYSFFCFSAITRDIFFAVRLMDRQKYKIRFNPTHFYRINVQEQKQRPQLKSITVKNGEILS